jgi:hypothetical protein
VGHRCGRDHLGYRLVRSPSAGNEHASWLARADSASTRIVEQWAALPGVPRWCLWIFLALLLEFARRPETLTRAEFFNEDGQIFFLGAYFGNPIEALLRPYQNYLHVIPRLAAVLEHAAPVAVAPVISNFLALVVSALVAAFIASDRLRSVIPDRRLRWLLALVLLLLPATQELLGSITYAQWYLALFLLAMSVADDGTSRQQFVDRILVGLACLTGPFGLLFMPLYWWRAWMRRDRSSAWLAGIVTFAAACQLIVIAVTAHRDSTVTLESLPTVLQILATRLAIEPVFGARLAALIGGPSVPEIARDVAAALLLAAVAVSATGLPRSQLVRILYATAAVLVAAAIGLQDPLGALLSPYGAQRYFFIPGAIIALVVVAAAAATHGWRRGIAFGLVLCLSVGVVVDLRLGPRPDLDWAAASTCIGGPRPCMVPVNPPSVWSIRWPGWDGVYVQGHLP